MASSSKGRKWGQRRCLNGCNQLTGNKVNHGHIDVHVSSCDSNATTFPASVLVRQINEQRTNRSKCDGECERQWEWDCGKRRRTKGSGKLRMTASYLHIHVSSSLNTWNGTRLLVAAAVAALIAATRQKDQLQYL